MMLPKLQELAGNKMFEELSSGEHLNYKVLIMCLKHQFHKVESAKTYATLFWRWDQKAYQAKETYVDELKGI